MNTGTTFTTEFKITSHQKIHKAASLWRRKLKKYWMIIKLIQHKNNPYSLYWNSNAKIGKYIRQPLMVNIYEPFTAYDEPKSGKL